MKTPDIIAIVSVGIALSSFVVSLFAFLTAKRARETNVKIFKRQGVISLHNAWQGTNLIDTSKPIVNDIVNAANALSITSTAWLHGVIEKEILYQNYWEPFRDFYDSLYNLPTPIGKLRKSPRSMLSEEITTTYDQMKKWRTGQVVESDVD